MNQSMRIGFAAAALLLGMDCCSAMADVVAVVSAKSPVVHLNREQTIDLFLGKTVSLPDGRQAKPIDQPDGSPERNEFYARFAGKSEAQIRAYWARLVFTGRGQPPREASNDAEMKRMLSENPDAIGYIERRSVDSSVRICAEEGRQRAP